MSDQEFRAVLDWWMCSDPWPVNPDGKDNQKTIGKWLEREAKQRGWTDLIEAFHRA
jgi:hypothetical protein